MPALVEATVARDLVLIRSHLAAEAESRIRYASPHLFANCTGVCLMWSMVVTSPSARGDAEPIGRCMLTDTLALLEVARPSCDSIEAPTGAANGRDRSGARAWRSPTTRPWA